MVITLSPVGEPVGTDFENPLTLVRKGSALRINGLDLDFKDIPPGSELPDVRSASGSPYLIGSALRDSSGILHLTIMFPHGRNAPVEARFPEPITVTEDGPVELPFADWEV